MSTTMALRAAPIQPGPPLTTKDVEDDGYSSSLASSSMSRSGLTPPSNVFVGTATPSTTSSSINNINNNNNTSDCPVLYSAIGSLENSSLTNMGSFQKRLQYKNPTGPLQEQIPRPLPGYVETFDLLPPLQTVSDVSEVSSIANDKSSVFPTQITCANNNKSKFNFSTEGLVTEEHTYDTKSGLVSMMAAAQIKEKVNAVLFGNDFDDNIDDESDAIGHEKEQQQPKQQLSRQHLTLSSSGEERQSQPSIPVVSTDELKTHGGTANITVQDETRNSKLLLASQQQQQQQAVPTIIKKNVKQNRRRSSSTQKTKHVTIDAPRTSNKKSNPIEMFRPSCDAYTPRMDRKKNIKYQEPSTRPPNTVGSTMGTISRPNFRDALRRVAMIIHQHIVKIERRFDNVAMTDEGLFKASMRDAFSEDKYVTPRYKVTTVRIPMARPGFVYGMRKIQPKYEIPTGEEIYEFAHQLFKSVQLSSECSIVCLIYVERLMEVAKVPLLRKTWRPIFMCGLLLASKIWQDLSSWNIEFASVYPQFSLNAINKLELQFLKYIKWDLYISSSLYAKYYFALRSLLEKKDFRQRYNRMLGVGGVDNAAAQEALKIQQRTEVVKEETLLQFSRSM